MDNNRLLGGTPLGVVLRLIVLSVVVGVVLTALGIKPAELLDHVLRLPQFMREVGDQRLAYHCPDVATVVQEEALGSVNLVT